jgi:hypothetical protein
LREPADRFSSSASSFLAATRIKISSTKCPELGLTRRSRKRAEHRQVYAGNGRSSFPRERLQQDETLSWAVGDTWSAVDQEPDIFSAPLEPPAGETAVTSFGAVLRPSRGHLVLSRTKNAAWGRADSKPIVQVAAHRNRGREPRGNGAGKGLVESRTITSSSIIQIRRDGFVSDGLGS